MTFNNPYGSSVNHHILSVLVQNRPGVLARVASLFARRGYNIFSLAVAPAEEEGMSRITIVVDVESAPLEQIVKQLFKLIDVVKISELDPRRCVERELLLATVRAPADMRHQVVELINISTSQMFSRTVITSGTTMVSVCAFLVWGTPVIQDLAFALLIGVGVGTYSSIWIAAPITDYMDRWFFRRARVRK